MEDTNISVRSRTNFAAVPNSFAQDKSLSFEAKGLALFLQSLPDNWKIYPSWIQREYNLSEWTWHKLASELRKHGCLTLYAGGNAKGSFYVFDLWGGCEDPPNPETAKNTVSDKIPRPRKTRRREKHVPYKETDNIQYKEKPTTDSDVVIDEIRKLIGDLRISASQIKKWVATYGDGYVIDKIKLMRESEPDSPERFLNSAIKFDWLPATPPSLPPQQEEIVQMPHYTHDENAAWFEARPEEVKKEIYTNAVSRDWRIKCHFEKANVRVGDEGFSNHWLFDYLMEQINRSQRQSLQEELSRQSSNYTY